MSYHFGIFPCKECQKRKLGCHSTCSEYIAACAKNEKIKRTRIEDLEMAGYIRDRIKQERALKR